MFFCFFYTALVFNSRETADNLRRSGAFIPGIRPGQQTAEYIDKVLTRLTFWGALYITAVCLLPEFMILEFSVPFYFGGTSLLIIVVVTMDFMAQLQAHMMTHQYEGLLKKANLRGYGKSELLGSRLELRDESQSIGAQDLSEVQDRPASRRRARDLRGSASQAAAGLSARSASRGSNAMARIAGINIPTNKHVGIALTHIFGIGRSRARHDVQGREHRSDHAGQGPHRAEVTRMREVIAKFPVEGDLRREVAMNIKRLMDLGVYRGIRHRRGLPLRGQRTRTNARTRKGPRRGVKKL